MYQVCIVNGRGSIYVGLFEWYIVVCIVQFCNENGIGNVCIYHFCNMNCIGNFSVHE